MRHAHGLVIGKFYPPHAGHHHLIDTAARACERVTVVVAAASVESIPLADRTAWLREAHPQARVHFAPVVDDVEIDYGSDEVWARHVEVFRHGLRQYWGHEPEIDAVFSSEPYGEELARRFGAVSVAVNPGWERLPVSGTAVRRDPVGNWGLLSPAVRAALVKRVAVVGAESSGTTTLARDLAAAFAARGGVWADTRWVPEHGRTYCEEKLAAVRQEDPSARLEDLEWTSEEFALITERQLAWEEAAARVSSPLLVCDTDAFATELWHERYLGVPPPARHGPRSVRRMSARVLWILTDVKDVSFEQDGWRDGEQIRHAMHDRFAAELAARGLPHLLVQGPPAERLALAVRAVDEVLARGWAFSAPLTAAEG